MYTYLHTCKYSMYTYYIYIYISNYIYILCYLYTQVSAGRPSASQRPAQTPHVGRHFWPDLCEHLPRMNAVHRDPGPAAKSWGGFNRQIIYH